MRLEHPHIDGEPLDMTDFDPFWEGFKRNLYQGSEDHMTDMIVNYVESVVRDQTYHEIKAPLMNHIDINETL